MEVGGIDFETYCDLDLKTVGLDRYVNHHSFVPLMLSLAEPTGRFQEWDFVPDGRFSYETWDRAVQVLNTFDTLWAHNAGFEKAVLTRMGDVLKSTRILDSAVVSRAVGASSALAQAAPQLLDGQKMEAGTYLIKMFSVPQEDGLRLYTQRELWSPETSGHWNTFMDYCTMDARLSLEIGLDYDDIYTDSEYQADRVTWLMNQRGWPVDLDLVKQMNEQYQRNLRDIEDQFHQKYGEINFRSSQQLQKWCRERGVSLKSFDELHVKKGLKQLRNRIDKMLVDDPRRNKYLEVEDLLRTKQQLGGSSLSKLQKILDTVGDDGRLRDQYVHVGAGQTYRTTGRGVQMQNLKRLRDPATSLSHISTWSNEKLAQNLRQVFAAEHSEGRLVVGDYSSVESRGLAFLAYADWKLDAYRSGKDLYKVLASSMLGVSYESVNASQRQLGKVGELACGYGAGAQAVRDFAEKMGVDLTQEQAYTLTQDWRASNPEIVDLWNALNEMILSVIRDGNPSASFRRGDIEFLAYSKPAPVSLLKMRPNARTLYVSVLDAISHHEIVTRVFQGAHMFGTDLCYYKPNDNLGGPPWRDEWRKDGQKGRYKLYGGKLAGIITQSLCREIFMDGMVRLEERLQSYINVKLIGQFHDELVVEWSPSVDKLAAPFSTVVKAMNYVMSRTNVVLNFPLAAEVNSDRRYLK